ncbi:MAG: SEC-C domain-containing protein, partial [Candidatus Omnitrophica bacterium]|nr:SEC-C domain-containing protein [Candidatus Omnitrophota bacterium]
LHIMGTERHESRRIDNQLRGRSGRQGDPGSSRFYLSLEDDLMRIFGSDKIKAIMDRLGMEEGEVIENALVTRAIQTAQKRVEGQNFEIRKHLLKYDDIMNKQREVIYRRRRMVIEGEGLKEEFLECLTVAVESLLENWDDAPEQDPSALTKDLLYRYAMIIRPDAIEGKTAKEIMDLITDAAEKNYTAREKLFGKERLCGLEMMVMLSVIDSNWKEYLREIDDLREGISWRAYGQKDPFVEFQHEAFRMFQELMVKIDEQTAEKILKISAMEEAGRKAVATPDREIFEHREYSALGAPAAGQDPSRDPVTPAEVAGINMPFGPDKKNTYKRDMPKVGRNDPCSCGSGKKYKKCCGK